MPAIPHALVEESGETPLEALARVSLEAHEAVVRRQAAEIAALTQRTQPLMAAIEMIEEGVACFDDDGRLISCNRRYAEIYGLDARETQPGAPPPAPLRLMGAKPPKEAVGAGRRKASATREAKTWRAVLPNGRFVEIRLTPLAEGGWVSTHRDITAIHERRAMAAERLSLKKLIDLVPDNLWIKDAESRFVVCNEATARRMGFKPEEVIGKTDLELCPPETAEKYYADEQRVVKTGEPMIDFEEYVLTPGGGKVWISTTKVPLTDDDGKVVGIVGISRDITARKLAETLRDGQAQILELIATGAPLADILGRLTRLIESQMPGVRSSVMLIDEDGVRLRHGAAPSLPEAYVKAIEGLCAGPLARSCGAAALLRERIVVADVTVDPQWADHREFAAAHGIRSCWSAPIFSHHGQVLGALALYSAEAREPSKAETGLVDVAAKIAGIAIERKLAEDRIQFMATHDALTGLPNRALLKDRLTQAMLLAERYEKWATVAFIDLDNFKYVNDSLGHNAGDELLKIVARRMAACLRATDTVIRVGGDEFVVVLSDRERSLESVTEALQRLKAAIAEPIRVGRHLLRVTCSLGVANYPNDGTHAEALLANADAAMYRAKENGRNSFQFYRPEINRRVQEKFRLQEALSLALARNEFVLHYQPQASLSTGAVLAVEALIRWRHPTLGLLSPARFIPLAEESGLIAPIGEWVLNEACRQAKAWQRSGLPPIRVSVNVSARQFKEQGLTALVAAALRESGLDAPLLELELTESLIMQDVDQAVATMQELERLGVQLSIDDFGTGYSSLAALKTFPVARLKIDRAFIQGLPGDDDGMAVAAAVISLGQKLNLKVIAEGVETADQVAFLRKNHCDEIQGYHVSKPIPPQELETFLREWSERGGKAVSGSGPGADAPGCPAHASPSGATRTFATGLDKPRHRLDCWT